VTQALPLFELVVAIIDAIVFQWGVLIFLTLKKSKKRPPPSSWSLFEVFRAPLLVVASGER
jgi:hypothetical protein